MSEKKDYLSELSKEVQSKKTIESFQEEKVVKVEKPKRTINPMAIVAGVVAVAVIAIGTWFLFFRPNIEVLDFVGKTQNDIGAWAKQQGVETSGIVFKEEFNFEHDKGLIVSQDVAAGTNVGKDAKITFVLSKGADPDEKIALPDIESMTNSELKDWISTNKLTKTKITTEFSETIEKDVVISYELKNVDANDFTRSTTLNIKVSKGPQPAGTVTLEEFKDKDKAYVESWAKSKKVELIIEEVYHDTTAKGLVITQSIDSGKTMKEGEKLTVTVSKGKAIIIPDFTKMTKEDLEAWKANKDNGVTILTKERYNADWTKYVVDQSIKAGSSVDSGETLTLTISIGKPRLGENFVGKSLQGLVDWCNLQRSKGADMYAGEWGTTQLYSNTYRAGTIINMKCEDSKGNGVSCEGDLPLDSRFVVTVSKGLVVGLKDADVTSVESIVDFLAKNQFNFTTDANLAAGIQVGGTHIAVGATGVTTEVHEDDAIVVGTKQP